MRYPLVTLGDCCEIVSGATPSTTVKEYWDGQIFWATPKDLSALEGHFISDTPRKLTESGLASCAATILPPNSVLFSSRAPIGHVAVNTVPMATNQGFKSFVPKPDQIDAKFLFHWLRANRSYLESLGVGATFKEVSKSIVSRVEIPLPSLPEQRHIAAILDKADTLRAQRRAAIANLDELLQSVFIEMFGDPISNPKAWVKLPIDSVADIGTGSTPSRANKDYYGGHIPWVKTTEIIGEAIVNTEEKLTIEGLRAIRGKLHPKGSVIVAMYGQGQTRGRCGLLMIEASCNQACGVIRPSKSFNSVFLLWQLRLGYERLRELGRGGNQENLNLQLLGGFEVLLPPLGIQEHFADVVTKIEAQRQTMQRAAKKTGDLFASLQQLAFSGKL